MARINRLLKSNFKNLLATALGSGAARALSQKVAVSERVVQRETRIQVVVWRR
jgi:hypothetical protein